LLEDAGQRYAPTTHGLQIDPRCHHCSLDAERDPVASLDICGGD